MSTKLSFSGHESFTCKQFWLKKVFDFSLAKRDFSSETAVIDLGVGKNMVASLRYWGRAFGIMDEKDNPTPLAKYIFGDRGKDPYLEDIGTIWLLHFNLLKSNKASIYSFVYNELRKERIDFTRDQLHAFLKRRSFELYPSAYNENTINTDINVFVRNYVKPHRDDKIDIEDDFSGIMIDLDLVKTWKQKIEGSTLTWYKIEPQERMDLPPEILLYAILDNYEEHRTISFRELLYGQNSPGSVFALNAEGLYNKIIALTDLYRDIVYTETAGNQVLQLKSHFSKQNILNDYYQK